MSSQLTSRWTACNLHASQLAYFNSTAKMNVVPAGRRSWKTEGSKRRVIMAALSFDKYSDGRFFACAPTQQQAKDIFWSDLKALVPEWALLRGNPNKDISESELKICLCNGATIKVAGLDKPARIEGKDWDGGVVDEYGDCKADVLDSHIKPMLARGGWIDVIGVPEGRNHYYDLVQNVLDGKLPNAAHFHWTAAETLHLYLGKEQAEAFLADMRASMDAITYDQEFNASFLSRQGRTYYSFDENLNVSPNGQRVLYDPELPLILMFDFNNAPGVCVYAQEQQPPRWVEHPADTVTAAIGEVFIRHNSNTEKVCDEVLRTWGEVHEGDVYLYGDAAGGAKTSSAVQGSDWDIIKNKLRPVFGARLKDRVARSNPAVRTRINAVNSRCVSADGTVGTIVDRQACPNLIRDFEGVTSNDAGEIIKEQGGPLTHPSDAWGYYMAIVHKLKTGITMRVDQL